MNESCPAFVDSSEISKLTDADVFAKYSRFRKMQANPTLRQCPKCGELCSPLKDEEAGRIIPEITCSSCNWEFCFYHSNAHSGRPCTMATAEHEDDDERLAVVLSMEEETNVCPNCSILTQKISGCNHMTCRQCQCEWCWVCGDKIDSVSTHYSTNNPKGCAQFGDLFADAQQERNASWFFMCCCCLILVAVAWWVCDMIRYHFSTCVYLLIFFCCCGLRAPSTRGR